MYPSLGQVCLWLAAILGAAVITPAYAQKTNGATAPVFVFASAAEGREILGTRDDYVRATAPLERSAKLRTANAVDEDSFIRHMRETPMEWTDEQRKNLAPVIEALSKFLRGVRWKMPERILITQTSPLLEDDLPHTRGIAIISPASFYQRGPAAMAYVLSHEAFHVITRFNEELREKLYAEIGFKRCETVVIPPEISRLRITNPDTVESRHTISVRYQGKPVEALPYIRLPSEKIDTRDGFAQQIQVTWLLVDRQGKECRARAGEGVDPQKLEGLFEQIGRNTSYLFHPEEILAENFVLLFLSSVRGTAAPAQSPEILEKIKNILFK